MKNIRFIKTKAVLLLSLFFITIISCERDLSDDAVFATFPNTAEVFTDTPVGLTDAFFISFDPVSGANTNGFGTDDNEAYEGSTSIRIDVPDATDPEGGFIGGIFKDRGNGRNLTNYDALTFWAKASTTATVGLFGFGTDFELDRFSVSLENVTLSTDWKKYTIPIPDPSRLIQEKGMFIFSAGSNSTGGLGYTFWIDEIKFEKLATIAQPQPAIFNGQNITQNSFNGVSLNVTGLTQTFNVASGDNVTVTAAPAYYEFESSETTVAIVNESGVINVLTDGTAVITAQLNGVAANGSLTLTSLGPFTPAPTPIHPASNVISIFSDAYNSVPVDYYNGFFAPFQTTLGGAVNVGSSENIISYTDLNFVAIGTFLDVPTVDATAMTHLHVDINVQENINPSDFIRLSLLNAVGTPSEIAGNYIIPAADLATNTWVSFDIPLTSFAGLTNRSELGLYFFVSDDTISSIYVDNLYFYN